MNEIKFIGDISLNGGYIDLKKNDKNPFEKLNEHLKNSFVVGNLECLSEGQGFNILKKPRLKTSIETLEYLKRINLKLALLANNHVYDNLSEGFKKTIDFLKENNISYIGAGFNEIDAQKPHIETINGKRVCFLNYVHHDTNPNLPDRCEIFLNWYSLQKIKEDLHIFKQKTDYLVVNLHWGGKLEGASYPHWEQFKDAEDIIGFGADLIIGHHSHTLQPYEVIGNKYVFYSIGNFCFSDFLSDGKLIKKDYKLWDKAMIVSVDNNFKDINYKLIKNNNLYLDFCDEDKKYYHRKLNSFRLIRKKYLVWVVYYYLVKILLKVKRKLRNR